MKTNARFKRTTASRLGFWFLCATAALLGAMPVGSARADAPKPRVEKDIPYLTDAEANDEYAKATCKLDLYLPAQPQSGFPLVVWFHGGGLTSGTNKGDKALIERFNAQGIAVANAGYRLSPKVKYPVYLQDAAKAVAWAVKEGVAKGANPKSIFVSGHSAGGYIAGMLAMNEKLLKEAGVPADSIAGYFPLSGQMLTHYTIREERGLTKQNLIADEASPLYYVRKNVQPLLLLVGDKDMATRLEENQLLASALKDIGRNTTTTLVMVPDRDHGSICSKLLTPGDKGGEAVLAFIKKYAAPQETPAKPAE